MITCHSVVKEFGERDLRRRVVGGLDCTIAPRTQLVVLGQRYSGKTTLLQLLAGQLIPTRGWVERRGLISPPGGLLRYASAKSSPRQFIALASRLYRVNHAELLDFVTAFSQIGWMIDKPLAALPGALRNQFNFALTYGVPFDFYLLDGTVGRGRQPSFRVQCMEAFAERRRSAGVIFATSNVRLATEIGGEGAIINGGRVTFYASLKDAVTAFAALPKDESLFGFARPQEEPSFEDEGLF